MTNTTRTTRSPISGSLDSCFSIVTHGSRNGDNLASDAEVIAMFESTSDITNIKIAGPVESSRDMSTIIFADLLWQCMYNLANHYGL